MTAVAPLIEPYASDPIQLLALLAYREGRSEPFEAKLGIIWTPRNRASMAPAQGFHRAARDNILQPGAFSSFSVGDPNASVYPSESDGPMDRLAWMDCVKAAYSTEFDPTGNAVFYYSPPLTEPPRKKDDSCAWGNVRHTASLGRLQFYTTA